MVALGDIYLKKEALFLTKGTAGRSGQLFCVKNSKLLW
jgi:hypothetical protein